MASLRASSSARMVDALLQSIADDPVREILSGRLELVAPRCAYVFARLHSGTVLSPST